MRSRFRRTERVFAVDLQIIQLDHIPAIPRLFYIHWRAKRATPPEGRTPSLPVSPANVIPFNTQISFSITIPSHPTNPALLQPAPLTLQLRSERKGRWISSSSWQQEGRVTVDLADVAAIGSIARNFLVQDSLLNTTLNLSIRVTHQSGDHIFRTRHVEADAEESVSTEDGGAAGNSLPKLTSVPSMIRVSGFGATAATTTASTASVSAPAATASLLGMPRSTSVSASIIDVSTDAEGLAAPIQNPTVVLENSIPNPELVQRKVYESMFQAQVRDKWPDYIDESRVDAIEAVDEAYALVCAEDGIGVGGGVGEGGEVDKADNTMSVEALIESRNTAVGGPTGSGSRRPSGSGGSPRLSIRSNSMGDLSPMSHLA